MKCLAKNCEAKGIIRGLCRSDYGALKYEIDTGHDTWEAAIAAGRVLPAKDKSECGKLGQQASAKQEAVAEPCFVCGKEPRWSGDECLTCWEIRNGHRKPKATARYERRAVNHSGYRL